MVWKTPASSGSEFVLIVNLHACFFGIELGQRFLLPQINAGYKWFLQQYVREI